jgi:hypothetical protein
MKKRWGLLTRPSEFNSRVQARIPCALAAVHNFILENDPFYLDLGPFDEDDSVDPDRRNDNDEDDGIGELAEGLVTGAEKTRAEAFRNHIAEQMWEDYANYIHEDMDVDEDNMDVG